MRTRLLAQLVLAPNRDYVESFQTLSSLNLEIRRHGPSAERLLRKAILELGVGNYAASLSAALDAQAMEPQSAEAHHQVGAAYFMLAMARAGAVASGPGSGPLEVQNESSTSLLARSIEAFRQSARLNPDDEEASQDIAILEQLERDCDTEAKLVKALRRETA